MFRYQDLDFRELSEYDTKRKIESWQSLVHVCRRWRGLVLGSPRRLNLQLCCTTGTPARETLDVWPALPLLIQGGVSKMSVDNVIAVLKHSDRICKINLDYHANSQMEKLWTAMQVPFPELAVLYPSFRGLSYEPVLPDSFLGGSTPRLRYLALVSVPFPGLPNLLLSATHLVNLYLHDIPHSGYISPAAIATCLSMLTSLEPLQLEFGSPQSCPDQENRRSPPPTRCVLPALTKFSFMGVNEYLEALVAWIDTPRLYQLWTTFFHDIDFDTPELIQFISRMPTFGVYNEARLTFDGDEAQVRLQSHLGPFDLGMVEVNIFFRDPDWQLSSLVRICTSSLRLLLTMENLYIDGIPIDPSIVTWTHEIQVENTEWLDLLLPFTAVKNLYLSDDFSPRIAPALQELTGGRTTEVLPALQNVFLEGFKPSEPIQDGIAQFISARQFANHPITVSVWDIRYEYGRPQGSEVDD
jgi:hypothetical protein